MPPANEVVIALGDVRRLTAMLQEGAAEMELALSEQHARWLTMRLLAKGVRLPPEVPVPPSMNGQTSIDDFCGPTT